MGELPDYWGNNYIDDTYFMNGEPAEYRGYCTDVFFGEAIRFIEQGGQNPFLCLPSDKCHARATYRTRADIRRPTRRWAFPMIVPSSMA